MLRFSLRLTDCDVLNFFYNHSKYKPTKQARENTMNTRPSPTEGPVYPASNRLYIKPTTSSQPLESSPPSPSLPSNPHENPPSPRLPRRRNPNLAAPPPPAHHVEPEGVEDAAVRQLPDAGHDPGRAPAGGEVHGVRPPHEPRPRRLRGVPPAAALQVLQDRRRAGGAADARAPPAPRRGGRLHDCRGPAPARRVPRQGRRRRGRARGPRRRSRRRPRGPHGPAAPGPAGSLWPCPGRRWTGPRHDAAADLAAPDAEPLGAAGGVPAGRAPAADADAAHAPWGPAAYADAVPAPAGGATCAVPWRPAAAVHEGTTADGAAAGEARDAGHAAAARDEAADAAAAVWTTAQAWDATTATWSTAAWTEPPAVERFWFGSYCATYGRFVLRREKSLVSVALLLLMGGDELFFDALYVKRPELV